MRGLNQVQIIGTLGRDPEVRYTPSGAAIASLNIATSELCPYRKSYGRIFFSFCAFVDVVSANGNEMA